MKLDIRVDPVTNKIVEAKFKTFGCGSAIASSSYLTTLVHGKTLDDAVAIKNSDIASELCLPPVKMHCSMLAEDAIKAAVADYRSKRPETSLSGTGKTLSQAHTAPPAQAHAAAAA
ncbi:MAG: iron-binding protein [Sporothrix thermara]